MDNRTQILVNAINLFSEKSYESVGVQQISDESGISKPTLYYYFGNKEGLMNTILNERIAPFLSGLKTTMHYTGDVMNVLKRTSEYYFVFAENDEKLYRLFKSMSYASEKSDSFRLVGPFVKQEKSFFTQLFESFSRDHGNIRRRYIVYAETFKNTVEIYVRLRLSNFKFNEEHGLLYTILHQFLHGIFS